MLLISLPSDTVPYMDHSKPFPPPPPPKKKREKQTSKSNAHKQLQPICIPFLVKRLVPRPSCQPLDPGLALTDHVSYGGPRSWYRSIYRSMHRSIYRSLLGRYSTDTRPMLDRYSTNARPRLGWNVAWVSTDASTASRSISFRLIVDVSTDSVGDLSVECR